MTPRQQKIWKTYRKLGSAPRAAKRLRITPQAVLQAIKRAGKSADRDPLSYDALVEEHMAEILAAKANHQTCPEIARELGMNPVTLRTHLKARGVHFGSHYDDKERVLWEKLYAQDMSSYDIHKNTGVPRSTIDRHLRSRGLLRDKKTATRLALATDPSKRRGGSVERPKRKSKKKSKGKKRAKKKS